MNRIEDHRVRFYLEHEEQIQTWAALARQASAEAHEFLLGCCRSVSDYGDRLGPDCLVLPRERSENPGVYLYRAGWLIEKAPKVAVGLEWLSKGKVTFSSANPPYIGIRVDRKQKGGADLVNRLREDLVDQIREGGYTRGAKSSFWPVYREEPAPDGPFWDDLTGYRENLIESLLGTWEAFRAPIDSLIANLDQT